MKKLSADISEIEQQGLIESQDMPELERDVQRSQSNLFGPRNTISNIALVITCGVLSSVLLAFFLRALLHVSLPDRHYHKHLFVPEPCGKTREEALAAGCRFDWVGYSWLPPDCYDGELVDEFARRGPWDFYVDKEGTSVAPFKQVRDGMLDRLYITTEHHMLHCTFQWRKMHRALEAGRPVDGYVGNYSHTSHCEAMLMMQGVVLSEVNAGMKIKFPACGV